MAFAAVLVREQYLTRLRCLVSQPGCRRRTLAPICSPSALLRHLEVLEILGEDVSVDSHPVKFNPCSLELFLEYVHFRTIVEGLIIQLATYIFRRSRQINYFSLLGQVLQPILFVLVRLSVRGLPWF